MNHELRIKNKKMNPRSGFTLIELMVASAIFIVVVGISVGSIISIVDGNKKTLAFSSIMNNFNFAMEDMSRSLREGWYYHCGQSGVGYDYSMDAASNDGALSTTRNCSIGGDYIAFESIEKSINNPNDQIVYALGPHPSGDTTKFQLVKSENSGVNWLPITSSNIFVESINFYVLCVQSGTLTERKVPL